MKIKNMRVLVADEVHANQWRIEQMLNAFGCYSVCTVSSFTEVSSICRNRGMPIDLLIINLDMVTIGNANVVTFFENSISVRKVLTYRCNEVKRKSFGEVALSHVPYFPDISSILNVLGGGMDVKVKD